MNQHIYLYALVLAVITHGYSIAAPEHKKPIYVKRISPCMLLYINSETTEQTALQRHALNANDPKVYPVVHRNVLISHPLEVVLMAHFALFARTRAVKVALELRNVIADFKRRFQCIDLEQKFEPGILCSLDPQAPLTDFYIGAVYERVGRYELGSRPGITDSK